MQDPEQFEADGGWNFLDMEGESGEEEEESEEGDPEFQGESDEEGASSEDYRSASSFCVKAEGAASCNNHCLPQSFMTLIAMSLHKSL